MEEAELGSVTTTATSAETWNYHATLIGGHLGRNRTLARLNQRFYWSGMADDVMMWA